MDKSAPVYERIYDMVRQIPPGRVATYGQIAKLVGGCSARMVGYALAGLKEGQPEVPWQRVINAKGMISPHGMGFGTAMQRLRLEEEGVEFDETGRINFGRFGWMREPSDRPDRGS